MKREVSLAENEPLAKICTTATHATTQSHASAISPPGPLPGRKSFPRSARRATPSGRSIAAGQARYLSAAMGQLSLALDKYWAASVVSRAGVAVPAQLVASSSPNLETSSISTSFTLFVKPQ